MKSLREELYETAREVTKTDAKASAEEIYFKIINACTAEAKSGKFMCVLSHDVVEKITSCTNLGREIRHILEYMLKKDDLYIEEQKDNYTLATKYIIRFNTPEKERK